MKAPITLTDKINLLLLLSFSGLLLFGHQQAPRVTTKPLLSEQQPLNEIRISNQQGLQLAILRNKQEWLLTHPQLAALDSKRVQPLLQLRQMPSLREIDAENLKDYGLDSPRLSVQFNQQQLHFGHPSTPPGKRYVRVNNRVHLVDQRYYDLASLPAQHYLKTPQD